MKRLLSLVAAAVGVAVCTGVAAPAEVTQADVAPYLHPQRLVDVGGHKINLYCTGRGSPSVILDAGEGETMYTWRKVQPVIAKSTRVCSFDRAGMGFSDGGPLPRDANAMVTDLHTVLQRANVAPPYVLVGHSIAGLYALLYADRYLQDVAGMVLVDPSFPNQTQVLHEASPTMKRMEASAPSAYTFCYDAALHGKLSEDRGAKEYAMCGFPPNAAAGLQAQCAKNGAAWCAMERVDSRAVPSPGVLAGTRIRGRGFRCDRFRPGPQGTAQLRRHAAHRLDRRERHRRLAASAGGDEGGRSRLDRRHERLAHLSSAGIHTVITHSEHFIQLDRPAKS